MRGVVGNSVEGRRVLENQVVELFSVLEKAVNDHPGRYVAVTECGEVIVADSREEVLKIVKGKGLKKVCLGHGRSKQIRHFIY